MKTLDKVLIAVGVFLAAFIVATVIIYSVNGWPYDVLIPCVVGSGLLETVNTMIITVNKIRSGKNVFDDSGDSGIYNGVYSMGCSIQDNGKQSVE